MDYNYNGISSLIPYRFPVYWLVIVPRILTINPPSVFQPIINQPLWYIVFIAYMDYNKYIYIYTYIPIYIYVSIIIHHNFWFVSWKPHHCAIFLVKQQRNATSSDAREKLQGPQRLWRLWPLPITLKKREASPQRTRDLDHQKIGSPRPFCNDSLI